MSDPGDVRKLLAKEYTERLRSRPVRPDLQQMESKINLIFSMKLKLAVAISSKPFSDWRFEEQQI